MGDEISHRTKKALLVAVKQHTLDRPAAREGLRVSALAT